MPTLYLIQQNTILRKRGNRLLLCKRPPASRRYSAVLQKDILLDLPCANVEHVMLFGNIQVTTSALHNLLGNGIELAIFSFGGELLGQLTPPLGKNIPLRIEQFKRHQDPDFALSFSKRIVAAKIANGKEVLERYRANRSDVFGLKEIKRFEELSNSIDGVQHLEQLLGVEGAAAAHYFSLFGRMIRAPWEFPNRNRRPPKDPVNAVLSFGYVVLGAQIQALLDGIGLDPGLGFYHQPVYGRPALALDLLEEFRHPLVDRLTVQMFNQGLFVQTDFFNPKTGGVYLSTSGKKKFFVYYERLLREAEASGNMTDHPTTLLQRQVHHLMESIKGNEDYEPFRLK